MMIYLLLIHMILSYCIISMLYHTYIYIQIYIYIFDFCTWYIIFIFIYDFFEYSQQRWKRYSLYEIGHVVWKGNEWSSDCNLFCPHHARFERKAVFFPTEWGIWFVARSLKPLRKAWFELSPQKDNKAIKKGADIGLVWLLIECIVLAS